MTHKTVKLLSLVLISSVIACSTSSVEIQKNGTRVYTQPKDESLKKETYLYGYVYDSKTKKAIQDASVEIKNANLGMGYYLVKTDSSGYYEIRDFIKHVKYIIVVTADNYVTYKSKGKITSNKNDIYMDPESIIKGRVTDSSGSGLPDVEVKVQKGYYGYGNNKPLITSTDRDGNYRFNKLSKGRYVVTFIKNNYIKETVRLKSINRGEPFTLSMKLYKPAVISGSIKIKDLNIPAVNINVSAKGRRWHSAVTFQDGSYIIEDLKPGEYEINVKHQGFYSLKSPVTRIREGQKLEKIDFTVTPKEPEVNVYSYRYTFAPGNKIEFSLKTFRLESVSITIYKVPLNTFLKGKTNPENLNPDKEKFSIAARWEEPVNNFRPYEWRYQTLTVKEPLSTGGYCIEVKGAGGIKNRRFFTLTSVGIVVKRSQYSVFAYVTDLITSKPVKNATVLIFDSTPIKKKYRNSSYPYQPPKRIEDLPIKIIERGKTDKDGIFHKKLLTDKHLSAMVISNDKSYAMCSTGSPSVFKREENKFMIYTDRPVYRAGDTVYYKIIGKKRKDLFTPLGNQKIYYKIMNRDTGKLIKEGNYKLDDWGTAHGKIKIDPMSGLGEYVIRAGPSRENLYASGRFYVEQYRKPDFKIEITPGKEYFINGDEAKFKVEAKYFFGAPLKGALVRYRFYESRLRDTDTSYWWEEDNPGRGSYNRIKLEGEKYLDDNGIAALEIHTGNYPYDREITLEATVVDKSNVSITSSNKVKVGRGEFYIKINPRQNFFSDVDDKEIEIRTLKHNGSPISTTVKIDLSRYIWKPYQRVYVHDKRPAFSKSITTNKKGIAVLKLPKKFTSYGEFDIIATGLDRRNNVITASRVIWIYNHRGGNVSSRFSNLEIDVNTETLKKARLMTCLIKTRFTDAYVCLTVEGKDIYMSRVIKINKNITPVAIPVNTSYAPNFYLTATMQRKRALFTSQKNISLPVKDTNIKFSIKPDKKVYLPGENAVIKIKAQDEKGNPVKADISLSVVDESIYYIRKDHTPKMKDFFYSKISNWVLTAYSYPISLLAGAGKMDKVKVREKFEDTAFWKADIRTNNKGKASVKFKLPDNLTTWRLTARGHDRKGQVGEKNETFLVTQELIARIGKPRFMIEKDRLSLIGIVNSNTKRGLSEVKTDFSINKKPVKPDKEVKISLPPFGSARNYYTLTVPEDTDEVSTMYKAVADKNAGDALRVSIPVQKRGSAYKLYGIGDMVNNKRVILKPVKEAEDFEFVPESITISLNPSPILQMLKATRFLIDYPYGCVEQTINRFIPVIAVQRLLKEKGYSHLVPEESIKKIDNKTYTGIAKLQRTQNMDGTWGWFAGDRGNAGLTGYALYALHLAEGFGYSIDKNGSVYPGLKAVKKMIGKSNITNPDEKAFLLYVYALWGKWDQKACENISEMENQTAYSRSFLTRAIVKSENNKKLKPEEREKNSNYLRKHISELKKMQKKDSRGIYWESYKNQQWGWAGANTEITAHVLAALVEAGDKSTIPSQIIRSLSKRSTGNAWRTTKQTASVILAMCGYIKKFGSTGGKKSEIDFDINGEKKISFKYDPKIIKSADELIKHIPYSGNSQKKDIVVTASGTAGSDVSYDIIVSGTLYFKPGGFLSIFKSAENSLDALSNGIQIFRAFSGITRVKDLNHNEYIVPRSLSDKKIINIGDEILVKVRFKAQDNFEYLVLEDFLPSGFEVIKKNAYDDVYKPYVRVERWDNRMVFFFTRLRKNDIYEVAYIIRAELPGEFMVRPTRMECMYEPSIQGWSAPTNIDVEKK